jgi:hypothetical protein
VTFAHGVGLEKNESGFSCHVSREVAGKEEAGKFSVLEAELFAGTAKTAQR